MNIEVMGDDKSWSTFVLSSVLVLSQFCWKASGAGTREIELPEHPGFRALVATSSPPPLGLCSKELVFRGEPKGRALVVLRHWGCRAGTGGIQGIESNLPANPDAYLFLQVPRLHPAAHLLNLHLLSHVQEAHQHCQGEAGLAVRKNAGDAGHPQKYTLVTVWNWAQDHSLPLS